MTLLKLRSYTNDQRLPFRDPDHRRILIASLSILGILAVAIAIAGTRWGPAVDDDSYRYITAARNLADGLGLGALTVDGTIIPLTHHPPLVSLSLAPFEFVGLDAIQSLRWINAFAFGLTVALSGLAIYWMTKSLAFSILGTVLILLSEVMIVASAAAMSEVLYLFLGLLGLMFLARTEAPRKRKLLVVSALLIGMAFLTRYVGIALVVTGVIWLVLDLRISFRERLSNAVLFVAISTLPMAIWVLRNWILFGNATNRSAMLHPIDLGFLRGILNLIFIWFIPGRLVHGRETLLLLALLLVFFILVGFSLRRWIGSKIPIVELLKTHLPTLMVLLSIYAAAYIGVFLVSRFVFDPTIYPINRLLAPLHHTMLLLLPVLLARIWRTGQPISRGLVLLFSAVFVFLYANRAVKTVSYLYEEGFGYTSRQWHGSEAIRLVESMEDREIYTNAIPAIYFWTDRTVRSMRGLQETKAHLESDCAALIVFDSIPLSLFNVTREEVAEGLHLLERDIADLYFHPVCEDEISADLTS